MEPFNFFEDINNPKVYSVFLELDRSYFIDTEHKKYSDYDIPLSIGYGQTISQPSLVAQMIDILNVNDTHRVLEIGTGSGYQTAFLAQLAKHVYTVEVIGELAHKAKDKLDSAGYVNISFKVGDGSEGWAEYAPFDRIIVSAASREVPPQLIKQLANNGSMIIPVGDMSSQSLLLINKDYKGEARREEIEKVRFVEFVGKYGWNQ